MPNYYCLFEQRPNPLSCSIGGSQAPRFRSAATRSWQAGFAQQKCLKKVKKVLFFATFFWTFKRKLRTISGNGKKNIHGTCIMDSGSSPELDRASRKCPVDLFSERASGRAGFLEGGVVANPPSVGSRSQPPPFNSREEPFPIRSYQTPSGAARKSAPQP